MDFSKYADGLIPAIIQDAATDQVLMLGFMNAAALEKTRESGLVTFYSRTRQRLWTKGETSGNFLSIDGIFPDCDNDTLLIKATPAGSVCHTGAQTCFAGDSGEKTATNVLSYLEEIIRSRQNERSADSYTSHLFDQGINRIAQKVGEEAIELVIEAKDDNIEKFKSEAADLIFHLLVLLRVKGVELQEVLDVLDRRSQ